MRIGPGARAAHATPLPPLPCSRSLPRALALVPGLASDARLRSLVSCRPQLVCVAGALVRRAGLLFLRCAAFLPPSPPSCLIPPRLLGLPQLRRPITVPPTRTPRGLAARGGVPARAHLSQAMGVPASRELRLRRRRLLARRRARLVLGCWRAHALARCARPALALRSRCARAAMHTRRPPGSRSCGHSTTTGGGEGGGPGGFWGE